MHLARAQIGNAGIHWQAGIGNKGVGKDHQPRHARQELLEVDRPDRIHEAPAQPCAAIDDRAGHRKLHQKQHAQPAAGHDRAIGEQGIGEEKRQDEAAHRQHGIDPVSAENHEIARDRHVENASLCQFGQGQQDHGDKGKGDQGRILHDARPCDGHRLGRRIHRASRTVQTRRTGRRFLPRTRLWLSLLDAGLGPDVLVHAGPLASNLPDPRPSRPVIAPHGSILTPD